MLCPASLSLLRVPWARFPALIGTVLGYDCHMLISPFLDSSPLSGDTCIVLAFFCASVRTRGFTENLQTAPGLIYQPAIPLCPALLLQEAGGSLKFPSFPFEHMPNSRTTVVLYLQATLRK